MLLKSGDARGQLPDRFKLLGVAQLSFEALNLGDVGAVAVDDPACGDGEEGPVQDAVVS